MAKPIEFSKVNRVWKPPQNMTDKECGFLPAYVDDEQSISCWRMSCLERLSILFTGRVWLGVTGMQPPVWVEGHSPFLKKQKGRE